MGEKKLLSSLRKWEAQLKTAKTAHTLSECLIKLCELINSYLRAFLETDLRPKQVETQPELCLHHYLEAGRPPTYKLPLTCIEAVF